MTGSVSTGPDLTFGRDGHGVLRRRRPAGASPDGVAVLAGIHRSKPGIFRFSRTKETHRAQTSWSKKMANNRVLIVSDRNDGQFFLAYHAKRHGLTPIQYPNIMSARKAVRLDPFCMVVVDLSMPVEPKLALVKEACQFQQEARVMTIGKTEYLKSTGVLSAFPSVVCMKSLDSFPVRLKADQGRQKQDGG
jgi:hypothetical protein